MNGFAPGVKRWLTYLPSFNIFFHTTGLKILHLCGQVPVCKMSNITAHRIWFIFCQRFNVKFFLKVTLPSHLQKKQASLRQQHDYNFAEQAGWTLAVAVELAACASRHGFNSVKLSPSLCSVCKLSSALSKIRHECVRFLCHQLLKLCSITLSHFLSKKVESGHQSTCIKFNEWVFFTAW